MDLSWDVLYCSTVRRVHVHWMYHSLAHSSLPILTLTCLLFLVIYNHYYCVLRKYVPLNACPYVSIPFLRFLVLSYRLSVCAAWTNVRSSVRTVCGINGLRQRCEENDTPPRTLYSLQYRAFTLEGRTAVHEHVLTTHHRYSAWKMVSNQTEWHSIRGVTRPLK